MLWSKTRNLKLLGAAASIGQPKHGVHKTPGFLRSIQIEKFIHPEHAEWVGIVEQDPYKYQTLRKYPIRNLPDLGKYNKALYEAILKNANPKDFFLTIGGDHSIGSSTVRAMLKVHQENMAVIWFDAHGDFNTPITTPSGNYHGMSLADCLGLIKEEKYLYWGQPTLKMNSVALIGVRALDPEEASLMDEVGVKYYTVEKLKNIGTRNAIEEILAHIDPENNKMLHLSLDVDGFDPSLFPGTGTTAADGLTLSDYEIVIESVRKLGDRFGSMDIVEINLDVEREITLHNLKEILRLTFK